MSKKSRDPDSPFTALKGLRDKLGTDEKAKAEAATKARIEREKKAMSAREEVDLWAAAVAGAKRIDGVNVANVKKKPPVTTQADSFVDENSDDADLQAMPGGSDVLDVVFTDEFVEGRAADCSKLDLANLRAGDFAVQATLDLHGLNRDEARGDLEGFVTESIARGNRCVLVICGRGLRTPGGMPVLKELLVRWLAAGRLSRNVQAFVSAKPHDGGVGAVYVLLRRHPRRMGD